MNGYENSVASSSVGVQNQPPPPPSQESTASVQKRRLSNRVQIHNLPSGFTQESIEQVLTGCGTVKKSSLIPAETGPFVNVIFDTPEEAQKAVDQLNNTDYQGSSLRVELINNNPANGRSNRNNGAGSGGAGNSGYGNGNNRQRNALQPGTNRGTGYPLRIMVPSEYVGAIIGRKGATIRSITTRCKARVDVHGKENSGLIEKVISIFGHPENCTNACKEILQVMQTEATVNNRGEVMLKMLTDDRYCGRIIGKEGKMIKKLRDDTGTKITVSNAQEMAALFPDRVIAIRGPVDGMSLAEAAISVKLAECLEHELQQQSNMGGMMIPVGGTNASYYPNNRQYDMGPQQQGGYYTQPMYIPMGNGPPHQPMGSPPPMGNSASGETCQIGVPNAAVGAIIGTAGANIKQMMRESGSFVNIESKKDGDPSIERLVCIKGNIEACWRASYMVFEKMKLEGFGGNDEVRLKTVIKIPKLVVGRIIGKGGKNVRELQRTTGAMIKLPEDPSIQGEEVIVEIYGNFMATQAAHGRIRTMSNQTTQQNYSNGGGPPSSRGAPRRGGSLPSQIPSSTSEVPL